MTVMDALTDPTVLALIGYALFVAFVVVNEVQCLRGKR